MRVPDFILKSIAFLVSIATEGSSDEYDFEGSGFLVGVRSKRCVGQSFFYFVTADHVVSRIKSKSGIRINLKASGTTVIPVERWFRHPFDKYADVAVAEFVNKYTEYDVAFIGDECFLGHPVELMAKEIGIGDEVWFPGLFSLTQQESDKRNIPILRLGNIAMMPRLPVPTEMGPMEAYLVEARSIGRISGSPVFARRTISILWNDEAGIPGKPIKALHGMTGEVNLIGMMHGHWDVKESEINQPRIEVAKKGQGVNLGIAIVVPFHKIMETINHPELVEVRRLAEDEFIRGCNPTAG
jgi:hypothetical protein